MKKHTISGLLAALALAAGLTACGSNLGPDDTSAQRFLTQNPGGYPESPAAKTGAPLAPRSVSGPEQCRELALGPWADLTHGPDPIGRVRDGVVPSIPDGGPHRPADKLRAFPTVESYDDPSTLQDPKMVQGAMQRAGYVKGIDARWGDDHAFVAITVVQYRDAKGAKDALTAHLTDLCSRAVQSTVRPDGAGLTLRRDSEAVRTLFVMDDIEVSVFSCACYWPDLDHREQGINDWALGVQEALAGPKQDTSDG